MNWLIYHIVSGQAFFSGVGLLVVAAVASTHALPLVRRATVLAFLLGAIAVALSSTAIAYWWYGVAIVATLAWMLTYFKPFWRKSAARAAASVWLVAACCEVPYHITPTLQPAAARTLTIVGDSVTAGMGDEDAAETWPAILARQQQLQVQDISRMGETAASAWKRVKTQRITSSVIVVEIGGNDILGATSASKFALDLDGLLGQLKAAGSQVVMLELPLPPFSHEFGRAQRTLAAKHNVALVPKRVFLTVLASEDATLDTIHLSQAGHQRMANSVWRIVAPAFETGPAARSGGD